MGVNSRWCRFTLQDDQGSVVSAGVVDAGTEPDLETVNLVARLALMAKRAGRTFNIADAPPELLELIDLAGLPVETPLPDGEAVRADTALLGVEVEG